MTPTLERDWTGPKQPKRPKQPRRGSGGNPGGAMMLLAFAVVVVPILTMVAVLGYIAIGYVID